LNRKSDKEEKLEMLKIFINQIRIC